MAFTLSPIDHVNNACTAIYNCQKELKMHLFTRRNGSYTVNHPVSANQIKENKAGAGPRPFRVSSHFSPARARDDLRHACANGRAFLSCVSGAYTIGAKSDLQDTYKRGKEIYTRICQKLSSGRHQWASTERFVINASEPATRIFGSLQALVHGIPKSQQFEMTDSVGEDFGTPLYGSHNALSALDGTSRLDLLGHGSPHVFNQKTPHELAFILHEAGLRKVGVIKFQACDIGKGNYLTEFVKELDRFNIQVGYVSGANGKLFVKQPAGPIDGKLNIQKPRRFFGHKHIGDSFETLGLVVVKGNMDVQFPNTRYTDASAMSGSDWK